MLSFITLLPMLLLQYLWLFPIKYQALLCQSVTAFTAGFGSNLLVNISFKELMKNKIVTKILMCNILTKQ